MRSLCTCLGLTQYLCWAWDPGTKAQGGTGLGGWRKGQLRDHARGSSGARQVQDVSSPAPQMALHGAREGAWRLGEAIQRGACALTRPHRGRGPDRGRTRALQEEWRAFESSRMHWARDRKALLVRARLDAVYRVAACHLGALLRHILMCRPVLCAQLALWAPRGLHRAWQQPVLCCAAWQARRVAQTLSATGGGRAVWRRGACSRVGLPCERLSWPRAHPVQPREHSARRAACPERAGNRAQSQAEELRTLARRQGSVIVLLERRILMLEDALTRERGGAGGAPAADASSSGLGSGRAGSSAPPPGTAPGELGCTGT